MQEKVKQFCDEILKPKVWLRIAVVLSIFFLTITCYFNWKNHTFYYPEKEYQILEEEARRLVEENEFSLELKTEYECIVEYYDMQSNELKFKLTDQDYKLYREYESDNEFFQSIPLYVKVSVKDCKAENKDITIVRWQKSATKHFLSEMVGMILLPILVALLITDIMIGLLLILGLILYMMTGMIERLTKKEERLEEENHPVE